MPKGKINQQLANYLISCEGNLTPATIKTKRQLLSRFINELNIRDMTKVRNRDIVKYKNILRERGNIAKTVNNNLDQISAFVKFLGDEMEEKITLDVHKMKRDKERHTEQPSFTAPEIDSIISNCLSPIEKLLIRLIFDTTLRISEVAKLRYKDISVDHSIKIKGKGGKDRWVFMTDETVHELDIWKNITNGYESEYVFPSPKKIGDHVCEVTVREYINSPIRRAGFEEGSAHALRRSAITDMIDEGMDMFSVQTIAGHSDPATTRRYYATSRQKLLRKFGDYQNRRVQNHEQPA